jgi:hypothetical protein
MTTTATALELALGQPAVTKIIREVKRGELPAQRQFERALAIVNPTKVSILSSACAAARSKSAAGKVRNAQQALLDFLLYNRDKVGKKITKADWLLLSDRYYKLHLDGVSKAVLGRNVDVWSTAESIWDYVNSLEEKQNFGTNNH